MGEKGLRSLSTEIVHESGFLLGGRLHSLGSPSSGSSSLVHLYCLPQRQSDKKKNFTGLGFCFFASVFRLSAPPLLSFPPTEILHIL